MKLTLFSAFIFISLSGCTHILKLTNNEDKGVKDVLNFYGGSCEYAVGVKASTTEGTQKYFELKLSGSDVAEKYFTASPDYQTCGMAYMFYADLKSEKKNYDEIHSIVVFKNGQSYQSSLSRDTLELIEAKMKVLNQVVDLIKSENFDAMKPLLSSGSYTDSEKNDVAYNLKKVVPIVGHINRFLFYGFRLGSYKDYHVINVLGLLLAEKQNTELSVKIDLKESEDKVHDIEYGWAPQE